MLIQYTPEELKKIKKIQDKYAKRLQDLESQRAKIGEEHGQDSEEFKKATAEISVNRYEFEKEVEAYVDQIQKERFKLIEAAGVDSILENAKQQMPEIIRLTYEETIRDYPQEDLIALGIGANRKGAFVLTSEYVANVIFSELRLHIKSLHENRPAVVELLKAIIEAAENSDFTDHKKVIRDDNKPIDEAKITTPLMPDSAIFKLNMPMYHGKATDALVALSNRDLIVNTVADKATIETPTGEYKITLQNFSNLEGKLSINTDKLLKVGIAEFTQINNYGGGSVNPRVYIPFDEYARSLGYEIDEKETDSPKPASTTDGKRKKRTRAEENKKAARRQIKQDLELLQALRLTGQETVKGKEKDFESAVLLEYVAIKNGYIILEFGRHMAEYLKQLPITQYPKGLLAIEARKPNAYRIGCKIAEYYNIDNNQIKGTANRIKVNNLLAVTKLPTIESLQNEKQDNSRQWYSRIKEPFETALDELTGKIISNWEYVKAKGAPLTEAEAYSINDYATFSGLYVQFELLDPPNHQERLARRAEEKKVAATKKAAKEKQTRKKKADS